MNKQKKIGIIFIFIGICIPLIALPFITGWSDEKSLFDNFYEAGIEIKKSNSKTANSSADKIVDNKTKKITYSDLMPDKIPFRIFLVITVILVYAGIVKIDRSKQSKDKEE
jgi:hypothetical protein